MLLKYWDQDLPIRNLRLRENRVLGWLASMRREGKEVGGLGTESPEDVWINLTVLLREELREPGV